MMIIVGPAIVGRIGEADRGDRCGRNDVQSRSAPSATTPKPRTHRGGRTENGRRPPPSTRRRNRAARPTGSGRGTPPNRQKADAGRTNPAGRRPRRQTGPSHAEAAGAEARTPRQPGRARREGRSAGREKEQQGKRSRACGVLSTVARRPGPGALPPTSVQFNPAVAWTAAGRCCLMW